MGGPPRWWPRFPGGTGRRVVAPVTEVVAPAAEVVAPVADLLATESEFIALVQHLLGSVAGAVVPLTQLQSELASFLFGSTGVGPVTDASGYPDSAALSAAVHASVASEVPLHLPVSRACRWPASHPRLPRSDGSRRRFSAPQSAMWPRHRCLGWSRRFCGLPPANPPHRGCCRGGRCVRQCRRPDDP